LSGVVLVFADGLERGGDATNGSELFFEDIRVDFRRFIVVTVIGVVFEIVIFLCEIGVDEADARVIRRVNKRSGGFVGLIERTVAMLKI